MKKARAGRIAATAAVTAAIGLSTVLAAPNAYSDEGVRISGGSQAVEPRADVREPGFVKHDFGDGKAAGWVSLDYLEQHPDAIPGSPDDSGFVCNGDVCIDVKGEGLIVDEWGTKAFGNQGASMRPSGGLNPTGSSTTTRDH